MSLTPGTRLGPYEVGAQIAVGGMGEVYRAKDTNLGRDVAVKVLPQEFAQDQERLARFEREAKTLASLNHPNIAIIHGLERAGGVLALVMELVEGPTLAERIAEGPLPPDEALPIARQLAEALEAAHELAIIHRDLKPANVKVRSDGIVKVLDFGLAKALDPLSTGSTDATASSTITSPVMMTRIGVILGTAAYMSPEQAKGRAADKRSDVWAFGCVLYEMLTGRRTFCGKDVTETLHAVIHTDPAWSQLPLGTPQNIRVLLRRCLQKDQKKRLPHIGSARLEIDDGLAADTSGPTSTVMSARSQRLPTKVLLTSAVAAASAATLFALAFVIFQPPATGEARVTRASILPPPDATWAAVPPATRFTISPDGRFLAFLATSRDGRTRLWVRALDALTARPLPGTDGALVATWSPDSRFLAFSAGGKLRKIDVSGGSPITLADMSSNNGITWSADDVILFPPDPAAPIFRVPSSGGTAAPATTLDAASGDTRHWQPFFLPDNRRFLYHAVGSATSPNEARAIYVASLNPSEKGRQILRGGSNAQYASGYLLFMRDTTLMAQSFNIERLELFGEAVAVAEHVQIGGTSGRTAAFSVSQAAALVYQTGGPVEFRSQLEWLDRTGKQLGTLGGPEDQMSVELSPDGTRVLASLLDLERRGRDLWIYDVRRNRRDRLTFDAGDELTGTWSPDGSQIVFNSRRTGRFDLYQKAASGAGLEELLLSNVHDKFPYSWSEHDHMIAYANLTPSTTATEDLWTFQLSGARKPTGFLQTEFGESRPRFSPDGRWLAYVSNELGQPQIFVTPFPTRSSKWQVSTAGGDWPRWRRDGKELFYLSPDNTLMAAAVSGKGAAFQVGVIEPLFRVRPRRTAYGGAVEYAYDVSMDGQRFLVNTVVEDAAMDPITLLVNWPALLKK